MSDGGQFASVSGVNPAVIVLFGQTTAVASPVLLCDITVGDTVWVEFVGSKLFVKNVVNSSALRQLGAAVDLNNYTSTSVWGQVSSVSATAGSNYPAPIAGMLEVFRVAGDGHMIQQRYTTYNLSAIFQRIYYSTSGWSAWLEVPTSTTAWSTLTLAASWVSFGGAFAPARYKLEGGYVTVEGLIKSGTTTASTVVATLPAGYRPNYQLVFIGYGGAGALRTDVLANGQIITGTGWNSTFTSLTGITFRQDQ